ncbi:MAG: hypothetical protein AUG14_10820 [Candidatus Rokubacteria bacterium 13_1_20CM_2_68_19]|nr:MAG: hypothetical protein AUI04_04835 [Candidatus Rokubacteria bacterium 13_2_20CM_2_64_8]OLC57377.1 MAG: hypothetical protein AUH76_19160 [Candidatus Rokubacteria bacterium 13_1_40CM_4_67_11]OLD97458.1 MAG: hypothetical protein AUG80_11735 [Candidatus Rokubacteria bacterium 13_1_20CM_4_68_9]OLE42931.1 MAG: hypothetical protein AUG14_10820 [Candidatus Rokubacteria bacterium 13_1_20CM_2_68_19]PYN64304.1 MAG: hypothetical protein DMD90_13695 [Candidatus Rokubacteria bacterium]
MDRASLAAVIGSASGHAALFSLLFVIAILLAVFPVHASNEDDWFFETVVDHRPKADGVKPSVPRPDGTLTVDLPFVEFLELQRLDDADRRTRLGLPANCTPGLTAMMRATSPSGQVMVMISCTPTTH